MEKMTIINLFGAPSCGKSTVAAAIFVEFKKLGLNVDLVGEKTKEFIYSGAVVQLDNQFYMTATQYKKLKDLERSNTHICISDSPLLLQYFYGQELHYASKLNDLATQLNGEFNNINILLTRKVAYNPYGRCHTEEQVNQLEKEFIAVSNHPTHPIFYDLIVPGTSDGVVEILKFIRHKLNLT